MQTDNRFLDGMAKFLTNAAGAAQAFKSEMEVMVKARIEKMIADLDFVPRDEFDAVKAMAAKARTDNEKLAARVAELEARLGMDKAKRKSARRPRKAKSARFVQTCELATMRRPSSHKVARATLVTAQNLVSG
jgi:BMFP domain-containing protein YqiC